LCLGWEVQTAITVAPDATPALIPEGESSKTSFGVESEVFSSEEEWIRERFSPLESWVVGGYTDFGDGDTRSVQTSMTVCLGA
jgi:hypothetical protein